MDKHLSAHSSDPSPTESANSQHGSELILNCSTITTELFVIYLWIKISVFTFSSSRFFVLFSQLTSFNYKINAPYIFSTYFIVCVLFDLNTCSNFKNKFFVLLFHFTSSFLCVVFKENI